MDSSRLVACTFDCYGTLIDWEGGAGAFLYDYALRVRDAARTAGRAVYPHLYNGAVATAATVQAGASSPEPTLIEWDVRPDRKSTRLNSSHSRASRMPSSA